MNRRVQDWRNGRDWSSRRRQRGTTLIEMASVMILIGMLLLLSIKALTAAGQLQVMSVGAMTELVSWQHVEARLRDDLARARSAIVDGPQQITLDLDTNRFVRFRVLDPRKMAREVLQMDETNQPQIVGRDAIIFPTPVAARWELLSPELVRLNCDTGAAAPRQIVALLGRSTRFDPLVQTELTKTSTPTGVQP